MVGAQIADHKPSQQITMMASIGALLKGTTAERFFNNMSREWLSNIEHIPSLVAFRTC